MKVSEFMTRGVRKLSPEASVKEAIEALLTQKISGLPVVDDNGKVVGMFTEKDVLRFVLPSYVSQVGSFSYENNPKTIRLKVAKLADHKVGDLMRKDVIKIKEETSLSEAAHIMLTQNVRRIPVVDADDKIVGIIARSDVLENILKG